MALIHCHECNREVSDKASACPQCGAPIAHFSKLTPRNAAVSTQASDVFRKGATQAEQNRVASGLWLLQVVVAAIAAGFFSKSWWVGGIVFLTLLIVVNIPILGHLVGLVLAAVVGLLGYALGAQWWTEEAGYVVGGLLFLSALGANFAGIQFMRDLGKK